MTTTTNSLPPIAASLTFKVADYAAWKTAFDTHEDGRRQAGILGYQIHRGADDANVVCVYSVASDRAKLESFIAGGELKTRQGAAGILGTPALLLLVPQENRTIQGRPLASAMVVHEVEDYDRWKAAFDSDTEGRERAGIVGHAVNRSATNPNVVAVYAQAESIEQLRAVFAGPDLKAKMQKAGVTSAPEITYLNPS